MSNITHDRTKENFYEMFQVFHEAESYEAIAGLIEEMKWREWEDEANEFLSELSERELKTVKSIINDQYGCGYDKVETV